MPILKVKNNGTWINIGSNADTLDGKHASEFATASDIEALQTQIGDEKVSDQITTAVSQKSQVQIITWEADD